MTDNKAIKILQQQIDKLRNDEDNRSNAWMNETRRYVVEFFGEDSLENKRFQNFNSWWILYPSIDNRIPNSIEYYEEEVLSFLKSCISTIKNLSITKKPKQNFLFTMKTEYVVLLFTAITAVSFALGSVIGIYSEKSETNELNTKITSLKIQLNNCKTTEPEKTIKNPL